MPAAKSKRAAPAPRHPEHKYCPFHGGVGVAIWLNEVQTPEGSRYFRSLTTLPAGTETPSPASGEMPGRSARRTCPR